MKLYVVFLTITTNWTWPSCISIKRCRCRRGKKYISVRNAPVTFLLLPPKITHHQGFQHGLECGSTSDTYVLLSVYHPSARRGWKDVALSGLVTSLYLLVSHRYSVESMNLTSDIPQESHSRTQVQKLS